ncbi:hypothetical protein BG005_004418 [Podila minutissima]|nr:hypothetical protein BG005_004418 [Podila minutissima]
MKFSTHLLAICAAAIMAAPGLTSAQVSPPATKPPTTAPATTTIPPVTKPPTTVPIPPITTPPPVTTAPPPVITTVAPPVITTTAPRTFTNSIITVSPTPSLPATCNSSADCPVTHICMLLTSTSVSSMQMWVTGQSALDVNTQKNVCTGFGRPGSPTECKNGTAGTGSGKDNNGTVGKTLMYAGIAVGGIAVLGIVFALVRWQRRRQRSKMPASMFGDMDYGVSNRRSAGLGASSAAAGGGGGGGNQYPFSSRPNAQEDNYNYDDNYYESPGGYNNNMHPMTGMAGGKMNDPYYDQGQGQDQYYDDQYYNKEGYNNNGYDQNGQYVGNGQDGFYDTQNMQAAAGYDNYQYPDQQQYDQYGNQYDQYGQYNDQQGLQQSAPAGGQQGFSLTDGPASSGAGVAVPPEAVVRATSPRHQATGDYAMDHYAVEPSELDFGGDTKGAQGGYGRKY